MLKKIGLSGIALAAVLVLAAPHRASAAVRFGVSIGAPAYTHPVNPDPYVYGSSNDPYAYPNYDYASPAAPYEYPAPVYVAPYDSYGRGGHESHEWREQEHRDYRAPAFRGHEGSRGGRR